MEKRNILSLKEYTKQAKKNYEENLNVFINYLFKKYFSGLSVSYKLFNSQELYVFNNYKKKIGFFY